MFGYPDETLSLVFDILHEAPLQVMQKVVKQELTSHVCCTFVDDEDDVGVSRRSY